MFRNLKENRWRTVAVDTRASWHFDKDPDREFEHVLVYQINDKTGERRMTYDDASDHGREYAENRQRRRRQNAQQMGTCWIDHSSQVWR
jgi:hypothetical protein